MEGQLHRKLLNGERTKKKKRLQLRVMNLKKMKKKKMVYLRGCEGRQMNDKDEVLFKVRMIAFAYVNYCRFIDLPRISNSFLFFS